MTSFDYSARMKRARSEMADRGVDVLLISLGSDLPYLTGYQAMPLERLTMAVVPRAGEAVLVVPELEALRVVPVPGVFTVMPWRESEDPIAIVTELVGRPERCTSRSLAATLLVPVASSRAPLPEELPQPAGSARRHNCSFADQSSA